MSSMRVFGVVTVLLAMTGSILAGDVQVVVRWPERAPTPEIQERTDASAKASVETDFAHNRVVVVNFPRGWSCSVTPASVPQPSVRVAHSAAKTDQVVIHAFMGREPLTDATLVAVGEVAEFPTANRIEIEVVRKTT